jgi:hypothetical protein
VAVVVVVEVVVWICCGRSAGDADRDLLLLASGGRHD